MNIREINDRRKRRYISALMLGIEIKQANRSGVSWHFVLPPQCQPKDGRGYAAGFFHRRWECVDAALRVAGVVIE